jgi:hypothetical protein
MLERLFIRLFLPLAALAFFCACSDVSSNDARGAAGRQWTFMVYMAADNDLDVAAEYDIKELMSIGSSSNVTILLQYDTRTTPTRLYLVEKDRLELLRDLGELSMADSDTLRDFVAFCINGYPAKYYTLVLWDHGNGWESGVDGNGFQSVAEVNKMATRAANPFVKSLLVDWNNTDIRTTPLPNIGVYNGLREAQARTGVRIDILGIDACSMATIEAAYEFRHMADIMVSSQDIMQGLGWDYNDLLGRLAADPRMSPVDLAWNMVDSYRQFVESPAWGYDNQTISAIMLGDGLENLAEKVDGLALSLKAGMDDPETRDATVKMIDDARSEVQSLVPPIYVDLYDFSTILEPAGESVSPVAKALEEITIAEYHGSKRPNAHGLDIVFYYLPDAVKYSIYGFDYIDYDPVTKKGSLSSFINYFNYDEMMETYFRIRYPDIPELSAGEQEIGDLGVAKS